MPSQVDFRHRAAATHLSVSQIVEALRTILQQRLDTQRTPIIVALDGPSGSGKSTLANALAAVLPATVVTSDDFFAADITRAEWDARTPMERARDAIDWARLRRLALEPLRAGDPAVWHPFDFAAGERADGSYAISAGIEQRSTAPVIILEGAYSARPELADVIDLTILVQAPAAIRHARLAARESAAFLSAWHERWDGAEDWYFTHVRPATTFDVVVDSEAGIVRENRTVGSRPPAAG